LIPLKKIKYSLLHPSTTKKICPEIIR